ncbi:MAG TPA: hypothetical protein VNX26_00580 [Candidatus Acidoferrum sp.]|jgi:hypothetical protein|nr:hypothetical protein [Candidatus Acidoferrum sp.]
MACAVAFSIVVVGGSDLLNPKSPKPPLRSNDEGIHGGTVAGVFRELGNAFVGRRRQPTVTEMSQIYRLLRVHFRSVLKKAGAKDAFNARVFKELCVRASNASDELTA